MLHISAQHPVTHGNPPPPSPRSVESNRSERRDDRFSFFNSVKLSTLVKNNVPCVKRQIIEKNKRCWRRNSWRSLCCFKETLCFATCEPGRPVQSRPAALSMEITGVCRRTVESLNTRCVSLNPRSRSPLYKHKHEPRDSRCCHATTDVSWVRSLGILQIIRAGGPFEEGQSGWKGLKAAGVDVQRWTALVLFLTTNGHLLRANQMFAQIKPEWETRRVVRADLCSHVWIRPPLLNGAELKKAEPRYIKSVVTDVEKYQHEPSLKHKCCRDQAGFQKSLQTFTITRKSSNWCRHKRWLGLCAN